MNRKGYFEMKAWSKSAGHSHFIACSIIMSWKDASFSSLSCFEEPFPSSLSVAPFCSQPVKKKGGHTLFGEMIKAIYDS